MENKNIDGSDLVFPQDARISFEEEAHIYRLEGVGEMTPVSTVIGQFFVPFDAEGVSLRKCCGDAEAAARLREEWSCKGAFASQAGTFMHKQIENFLTDGIVPSTLTCRVRFDGQYLHQAQDVNIQREWSFFQQFYEGNPITPFRTEWCVYDEALRMAGTIDLICKRADGTYELFDWKRSNRVDPTEVNRWQSGIRGLEHLTDTSYSHYCLQQNLYRHMVETHYGLPISRMHLVVLHPDNSTYRLVPVPRMEREVAIIYKNKK